MKNLLAGAGVADITPLDPQYLFGYPHVERTSTGVHDPLLSSALYLFDGRTPLLFVANDIIFVGKATAGRVRQRIEEADRRPCGQHPRLGDAHPLRPLHRGLHQPGGRSVRPEG